MFFCTVNRTIKWRSGIPAEIPCPCRWCAFILALIDFKALAYGGGVRLLGASDRRQSFLHMHSMNKCNHSQTGNVNNGRSQTLK